MYVPKHFDLPALEDMEARMAADPFALLVSMQDGTPVATHLPVLAEWREGELVLSGHMARANGHWQGIGDAGEVLVVFSGPHGYVSPRWYVRPGLVPTWNYEAVHAYGTATVVEDPVEVRRTLDRLTAEFEGPDGWSTAQMEAKALTAMMRGIVAFDISVTRLEGKSKMSQNRSPEDIRGAVDALSASDRPSDHDLASLMTERNPTVFTQDSN